MVSLYEGAKDMTYRMRSSAGFFAVLFVALGVGALPGVAQSTDYLISFQPGTSQSARAAAAARNGAALRYNYSIIDSIAVRAPNQNVLRALSQDPSVLRITPDYPVFASQAPQAPEHVHADKRPGSGGSSGGGTTSSQAVPLGVQRVLKSSAAPSNSAGSGIGVAIVDTGIDYAHADLMRNNASIVVDGYNALDNSDN